MVLSLQWLKAEATVTYVGGEVYAKIWHVASWIPDGASELQLPCAISEPEKWVVAYNQNIFLNSIWNVI